MKANNMQEKEVERKMDYNIRSNKVRVIDNETGETKIMFKDEAIAFAHSQDMNLVEISFNKNVYPGSICKIMDYAKYKYDQKKLKKERAKKARATRSETKSLAFTIRIDDNDKAIKLKHAREFIADGDKVEIVIRLNRREMLRKEMANDLLHELIDSLKDVAMVDGKIKNEGRFFSCLLTPIKTKK